MLCYELSLHIAEQWDTAAVQEQHFPEVKMEIARLIRTSKTRNKIFQIKEKLSSQTGMIQKCTDQRAHDGKWQETDDFEISNQL